MGITPVDNSSADYQQQWTTPILGISLIGGIGVALIAAAVFTQDNAPGRLIATVAGLIAIGQTALALRQRPRLAIDAGSALVIGRLKHPAIYLPTEIVRIRTTSHPRLGRHVHLLELDLRRSNGAEEFVVLTRWDLGTDPRDVLAVLERHGLTG